MLRDDPIVAKYPKYLPSEDEVSLTWNLLNEPRYREVRNLAEQTIVIGGCLRSSLLRFCWQAKQQKKCGRECAEGAVDWIRHCIANRQRLQLNSVLIVNPFPQDFCDLYTSTIPCSIHGTDRYGHPVFITRYGRVDIDAFQKLWLRGESLQKSAGLPVNAAVLYYIRMMEYITKIVMQEETKRRGRVVDRILAIIDLGGLGLKHIQQPALKSFLGAISSESVPVFPETLHATIVANVPWLVSRAVWPLAKQMMHPVTQAKFSVLATTQELLGKLCELMDLERIPPYFGGRCNCEECFQGQLRGGSMWQWERDAYLDTPSRSDDQPAQVSIEPWEVEESYLIAPEVRSVESSNEQGIVELSAKKQLKADAGGGSWFLNMGVFSLCLSRRRCCRCRNSRGQGEYSVSSSEQSSLQRPAFLETSIGTCSNSADMKRPSFLPPSGQSSSSVLTQVALACVKCGGPFVICAASFILARMMIVPDGASFQRSL